MSLTIGIDGDGVIFDYVHGLRESYPSIAQSPGPFTYNMIEPGWFPDKQTWLQAHLETMERCHNLPLNDLDSAQAVDMLRKYGHKVVLATARNPQYEPGTIANLKLHGIEVDDVIHTGYAVSKGTLGLDMLLDDKPGTIKELIGSSTYPVIYHQPYNADLDVQAPRVKSMLEFATYVLQK